jgi:hypothetical protein
MGNETVVQMYMIMASARCENENRWMNPVERQKLTGSICSFCATPLPQGTARRQTYCEHCPPAGAHHVRMDFRFVERWWRCGFWDADAGKMLAARLCFEHADSLYTLAQRGRGFISGGRKAKVALFNAIGNAQTSTLTEGK